MRRIVFTALVATLSLGGVSGCASETVATPAETVTVTAPAPIVTSEPEVPEAKPAAPVAEAPTESQGTVTVPKGVGLNYQQAQDLWRGVGLVVLPATDATGANRLPIIDSNWIVLSQSPKPGSKVVAGSDVTATVKKYTDN